MLRKTLKETKMTLQKYMKLSNVRMTPKEKLTVKTKYGIIANENQQPEIKAKYFENSFDRNAVPITTIHNDKTIYIIRNKKSRMGFKKQQKSRNRSNQLILAQY